MPGYRLVQTGAVPLEAATSVDLKPIRPDHMDFYASVGSALERDPLGTIVSCHALIFHQIALIPEPTRAYLCATMSSATR